MKEENRMEIDKMIDNCNKIDDYQEKIKNNQLNENNELNFINKISEILN